MSHLYSNKESSSSASSSPQRRRHFVTESPSTPSSPIPYPFYLHSPAQSVYSDIDVFRERLAVLDAQQRAKEWQKIIFWTIFLALYLILSCCWLLAHWFRFGVISPLGISTSSDSSAGSPYLTNDAPNHESCRDGNLPLTLECSIHPKAQILLKDYSTSLGDWSSTLLLFMSLFISIAYYLRSWMSVVPIFGPILSSRSTALYRNGLNRVMCMYGMEWSGASGKLDVTASSPNDGITSGATASQEKARFARGWPLWQEKKHR